MTDKLLSNIQGFCDFYIQSGDKPRYHESRHNIVVNNCRRLLRDLVYGKRIELATDEENKISGEFDNPPTISHLVVGNMNLTLAEAQQGVQEATTDETTLVNPTLWIPVVDEESWPNNKKEAVFYNGNHAIQYTFVLGKDQGNSIEFFCELGLAVPNTFNPSSYLFTKMNRLPIVKSENDEITMVYTLIM